MCIRDSEMPDLSSEADEFDYDDQNTDFFNVGKKVKIDLRDLDYISWKREMDEDIDNLQLLILMIEDITPEMCIRDRCNRLYGYDVFELVTVVLAVCCQVTGTIGIEPALANLRCLFFLHCSVLSVRAGRRDTKRACGEDEPQAPMAKNRRTKATVGASSFQTQPFLLCSKLLCIPPPL